LRALVQGKDIGDGFFMTFIVTDDELPFDAHRGAFPGSRAGEGIESFYASCLISPSIFMLSLNSRSRGEGTPHPLAPRSHAVVSPPAAHQQAFTDLVCSRE
jgi:hypothetical protein